MSKPNHETASEAKKAAKRDRSEMLCDLIDPGAEVLA